MRGLTMMMCSGLLLSLVFLLSCTPKLTKQEAFPNMYQERPLSILVLPPINESTAAEAKEYYMTTIAEPLANAGYYVYPTEVVADVLDAEGLYDTEVLNESSIPSFGEYFGADAVMFIRILEWDTSYYVVGGNVEVKVAYKLYSTATSELLWKYEGNIKVDTTGDSGNTGGLLGALVQIATTAVKTATTDYVPLARKANVQALISIPYGKYHLKYNKDQSSGVVIEKLVRDPKEKAPAAPAETAAPADSTSSIPEN